MREYDYGIITEGERKTDLVNLAKAVTILSNRGSVLDLGCGRGGLLEFLVRFGCDAKGYEKDPNVMFYANETAKLFIKCPRDIKNLTEEELNVSCVTLIDVLHEMSDGDMIQLFSKFNGVKDLVVTVNTSNLSPVRNKINNKSKKYWIDYISKTGMLYKPEISKLLSKKYKLEKLDVLIFGRYEEDSLAMKEIEMDEFLERRFMFDPSLQTSMKNGTK
jgi:cyclopropane fatty-acyl-phospholipid synthase-like methyltransferase